MQNEFWGMTPDEQIHVLCHINGPITMLVALEQYFRDHAEEATGRDSAVNRSVADALVAAVRLATAS